MPCGPGYAQALTGQVECVLCQPGTYQDKEGQTECVTCFPGSYSTARGSSSIGTCQYCEPGNALFYELFMMCPIIIMPNWNILKLSNFHHHHLQIILSITKCLDNDSHLIIDLRCSGLDKVGKIRPEQTRPDCGQVVRGVHLPLMQRYWVLNNLSI